MQVTQKVLRVTQLSIAYAEYQNGMQVPMVTFQPHNINLGVVGVSVQE